MLNGHLTQLGKRVTERCVDGEALKSVDGIKEGEALNNFCVDVEGTLQSNQGTQLVSLEERSTEMAAEFNADGINDMNVGEPLKLIN